MPDESHAGRGRLAPLRRGVAALALAAAAWSCAAGAGPGGSLGGSPGNLRDDDALLISRFSDVLGIAASRRYVFVAGPRGLAIYDAQFDWWLPPRRGAQQLGAFSRAVMAADPVSDAVWMGGQGEVRYYQPNTDYAFGVPIAGIVDLIAFDARDPGRGAYVRAGGGWSLVSTAGGVQPLGALPAGVQLQTPPDLGEVYRRYPNVRDLGPTITTDERLRTWQVTVGTIAPDRGEVFLGTLGNGVYRVDPAFARGRQLPYGLLSEGAGAVARAADGVWVAPLGLVSGLRARGGLTFVRGDLQEWRWIEDERERVLENARTFDLQLRGSIAWVATDQGVVRIDTRASRPQAVRWALINGLPADDALAVEPREGGAWVGTTRGLAWVSDTGRRVQPVAGRVGDAVAAGLPVRALLATGDTLWMGTDAGLLLLPPGEQQRPVRSSLQEGDARLAGRIAALAASDSIVAVGLGTGDVVQVDRRAGRLVPRGGADVRIVGPVVALAMDPRSLYVLGISGLVAVDRVGGTSRYLSIGELGGEAYDVLLTDEAAWVATRAGVVRLARRAGGLPR